MSNVSPLRAYRAAKRLSLEQLGAVFGVNKTTIMRWEEGQIPPLRVFEVERRTGIQRHELRPDLWPAPGTNQTTAA